MNLAIAKVLITDLDNTVYDWVSFFAPSFRAMVHVLARETGLSESVIVDQFRAVYAQHGSVEYVPSVQELDVCKTASADEAMRLVKLARVAFGQTRRRRLTAYDGVKETLIWAKRSGLLVVAVTNAPLKSAAARLVHLGLSGLFAGVAGMKTSEALSVYHAAVGRMWALDTCDLKPSTAGYQRVFSDLGTKPERGYVVGDSLRKDIAPAMELGATGIWAAYGTVFDDVDFETLLAITPWSEERIASTYDGKNLIPDFTITSFSELRRLIAPPQAEFF
jgi:FMN phosphatase YigB (HAD superfamily)